MPSPHPDADSPRKPGAGKGAGPRPRHTRAERPHDAAGGPVEGQSQDKLLDEGLEETFPASDPVSVYHGSG